MGTMLLQRSTCRAWTRGCLALGLCMLTLLVLSCAGDGTDIDRLEPPPLTSPRQEEAAIASLRDLYRMALLQEDIDRLQDLLVPEAGGAQADTGPPQATEQVRMDAPTLRNTISETFRTLTIMDVRLEDVQVAADRRSIAFMQVESVEDPFRLEQRTRAVRTTLRLDRGATAGRVTFRIAAATQDGPVLQVVTPGQVVAGALARFIVTETTGTFAISRVEVESSEAATGQTFEPLADGRVPGTFQAPERACPQSLCTLALRIHSNNAQVVAVAHRYRLRGPGGVLQPIAETETSRFFAVETAADGTIWFGGEAVNPTSVGRLVQVAADSGDILRSEELAIMDLPPTSTGRIADITCDQRDRLQILFLVQENTGGVVANGVVVLDPQYPNRFCPTFGVNDPDYPLLGPPDGRTPSPSARVVAAEAGALWLFGSDGGVTRVRDTFRNGQCPEDGVEVSYDRTFRRQTSDLPTNSVLAFVPASNGALWFGTALGLVRVQGNTFNPFPFGAASLVVPDRAATLETYFQRVAEAIVNARPHTLETIENVSFLAEFGRPLVKEDLIFSAVEDRQGRLWVGTLGGGLRRIDPAGSNAPAPLHLTRHEGLGSNIIFALAGGPDDTLWAATDEGLSRLELTEERVTMRNFSAMDGLFAAADGRAALPVRDVVVDATGTVFVATDRGAFRVQAQTGRLQGRVVDAAGNPVEGADIVILGTAVHAVTDAAGHFVLTHVPLGGHQVQVSGALATGGPLTTVVQEVEVVAGPQTLALVTLAPRPPIVRLEVLEGQGARVVVNTSRTLSVRVVDASGAPVADVLVMFRVRDSGRGTLSEALVTTTVTGQASTMLMALAAGEIQVESRVTGLDPVIIRVTGVTEPPPDDCETGEDPTFRLILVSGDNQVVPQGEVIPAPLVVRLEDAFGEPVARRCINAEILVGVAEFVDAPPSSTTQCQQGAQPPQGTDGARRTEVTDANGEVRFCLRPLSTEDLRVVASAQDAPQQRVPFRVFVGFASPFGITVEADGNFVVADPGLPAIARVDPISGERTLVSGLVQDEDEGFPLQFPLDIAVEASGTFVMVDNFFASIVRVDPRSGNRTLVSGPFRGWGPELMFPEGIAVEEPEGTLVVIDRGLGAILRVHPTSGDRSIVSGSDRGSGPAFVTLVRLAVEADGTLVVGNIRTVSDAQVMRVHPVSGDRTVISDNVIGGGDVHFEAPLGIAVEPGGSLVVVDRILPAVIRVDPMNGNRSVLSGLGRGEGPSLVLPQGIAVDGRTGTLAVTDIALGAVRVDPVSGNRSVLGNASSDSTPAFFPVDIAVDPTDGTLVVADAGSRSIIQVHTNTGERTAVSGVDSQGNPAGSGPRLEFPFGIAVEADHRFLVVDPGSAAVLQVEPSSGERIVVSRATVSEVAALTYWDTEGIFLLADRLASSLFRLTTTGEVTRIGPIDHASKGLAFSTATTPRLYSLSRDDAQLRVLDPVSASTVSQLLINHPAARVLRGNGLATHPETGALWALLTLEGQDGRELVILDPVTGTATPVGNTGGPFAGIAFDAIGTLYGVTGDAARRFGPSALAPETLFTLSKTDATVTVVLPLGRGDDGEALSFNPIDGFLYHASGWNTPIFEAINLTQLTTLDIPFATGGGPSFFFPRGIAIETPESFVVTDLAFTGIVRVNRNNGNRMVVSDPLRGDGFLLSSPVGIVVETDHQLVVADALGVGANVIRVDPVTGNNMEVSGSRGTGPPLRLLFDIAREANGMLVVVDDSLDAVIRVHPTTGDRTIVSGIDPRTGLLMGAGPLFRRPLSIAVETNSTLVVGDLFHQAVFRVDPVTGDRTILSSR